jgi:hypothetical protein
MKKSILLLALFSQLTWAACDIKTASIRSSEQKVGPITNLVKDKSSGRCTVKFDITVDGTTHHLIETETGWEQEESLCYYARERARKELLLDLGGAFQTEAVTVCKEGLEAPPKITIGSTILESEVGKSKLDKYFIYRGQRCRMFTEKWDQDRKMVVYNGVICQIGDSSTNWQVMDKW